MERIKLAEIDGNEINVIKNGFNVEFETIDPNGSINRYDNIEDFADIILILSRQIGYFRLMSITRTLLEGDEPELTVYEKEALG